MPKSTLPGSIIMRHDEKYVATVVKVESKDQLGRPKNLTFLYDEESIHLEGGEAFLIVYVKADCIAPETKANS